MKRTPKMLSIFLAAVWFAAPALASHDGPLLIHGATATAEHVVFSSAGQLWRVPLAGGEAEPLTRGESGDDRFPQASPDGRWIAFSRADASGSDVWVMASTGGEPRRLTYHPKPDRVRGWTPDSRAVLFASGRDGDGFLRLYTIGREAVFPEPLPLPQGYFASFSPDGRHVAYAPYDWGTEGREYRYYRGGETSPLWIAELADSTVEVAGEATSNHRYPMWIGDTIYFLGDADGAFNLYAHDPASGRTRQLTDYHTFGIRSAAMAAGGEYLVFVRTGGLHLFELASGEVRRLAVRLAAPGDELVRKRVKAADWLQGALPVGDGERLLLAARGDLLLFDRAAGTRNLTASSNTVERQPALSPDGRWLAYFSDASGEYQLHWRPADGSGGAKALAVEERPSFYRQPVFSPDGQRLAFCGKRLGLWLADFAAGTVRRIDRSDYLAQELWHPAFSPDGRYLAYAKAFADHRRAIFVHDLSTGERHRVTPPLMHAEKPVFDANGKYLHFLSSDTAPAAAGTEIWGQLSAEFFAPNVVYRVETVVLRAGEPAPLLPFIAQPHPDAAAGRLAVETGIDFAAIEERIVPLPLRPRVYRELAAGPPGVLLLRYRVWPEAPGASRSSRTPLYRYDLASHDFSEVVEDVDQFTVTADGRQVLYRRGEDLLRVAVRGEEGGEPRKIDLSAVEMEVDPAAEWRQIYREAWRLMRDYFYDPGHHGRDLEVLAEHFAAYLPGITRRTDLTFLLREMLGQVSISHMGIGGGDTPPPKARRERVGLLGARFEIADGRYRVAEIFRPGMSARSNGLVTASPLAQPGSGVSEGDYLLAVDGKELDATANLYAAFIGTAGRPTTLRFASDAAGREARQVTLVPVPGENGIQRAAWFEANRRRVAELSGGRIGYIIAPNFGPGAIQEFIGQLTAQADRDGLVIDQRFGPGGITPDSLVQMLTAAPLHRYAFPYGKDLTVPTTLARGPKVLLIHEHNFSASETFPLMFKLAGAGTIVGKRTAGAGTGGALAYPRLIDGGRITIPNRAAYDPADGRWAENDGVHPDVEVEWWPADWRRGRDPQLETAVEIALEQAATQSVQAARRPAYPVHPDGGGS